MKLLIILFTVLVINLTKAQNSQNQWASSSIKGRSYQCRWNNGKFKCMYQYCNHSFDGKRNCTSREGPPPADVAAKAQMHSNRYQCKLIDGKLECLYTNCTISFDGKRTCTSRKGPPPAGVNQALYQTHTSRSHCNCSTGKMICTYERCTILPNGKKNCSTTTSK